MPKIPAKIISQVFMGSPYQGLFPILLGRNFSQGSNMAGPKGLSAALVKAIFRSKDPASSLAKQHKVSVNLVYLIQQRKIHKAVTESIRKPIRKRRRASGGVQKPNQPQARIDVKRLAERVADMVTKRVLKGLVDRLSGKG